MSEPGGVTAYVRPHVEVGVIKVLRDFEKIRLDDDWDYDALTIARRVGLPLRIVDRALRRMVESGEVTMTAPRGWRCWYPQNGQPLPRADRTYRVT